MQECGAGLIDVRIDGDHLAFTAPPSITSGEVGHGSLEKLIEVAGVDPGTAVAAQWLDNGPGWVGLLLDSDRAVLTARPNAAAHPERWDTGLIGPVKGPEQPSWELRAFFGDGDGVLREDPVTGSLNAAAAQRLIATGRACAPFVTRQGTAIGRRGRVLISHVEGTAWTGGLSRVVVRGDIEYGS